VRAAGVRSSVERGALAASGCRHRLLRRVGVPIDQGAVHLGTVQTLSAGVEAGPANLRQSPLLGKSTKKKAALTIGCVTAQLLAVGTSAQRGEGGPKVTSCPSVKEVLPAEKAEGQAKSKAEGAEAVGVQPKRRDRPAHQAVIVLITKKLARVRGFGGWVGGPTQPPARPTRRV
jgi:hypothetical protein